MPSCRRKFLELTNLSKKIDDALDYKQGLEQRFNESVDCLLRGDAKFIETHELSNGRVAYKYRIKHNNNLELELPSDYGFNSFYLDDYSYHDAVKTFNILNAGGKMVVQAGDVIQGLSRIDSNFTKNILRRLIEYIAYRTTRFDPSKNCLVGEIIYRIYYNNSHNIVEMHIRSTRAGYGEGVRVPLLRGVNLGWAEATGNALARGEVDYRLNYS